jgi:hypothetical protein
MAVNQAEIFSNFERLYKNLDKNEFIYDFLSCYGYAPATITLLKKGDRNVAANPKSGEVALKNGVYFKPLMIGEDIYEMADRLIGLASNKTNKIRFVIVTDFVDVIAHDLKSNEPPLDCSLASLHENYSYFLPLAGYEKARGYDENPADVKAAEQMGRLFDLIREKNKPETPDDIHGLNVFLTRLLFCFFAEDTGIFDKNQMTKAIDSVTNIDGSDVSTFLETLFEVLNEPDGSPNRLSKAAHFRSFPYVNGGLFKTKFPIPEFTSKARRILIDCGTMQWEDINPDIFGSMFQSVIDENQRGNLGQHYTSVTNIMKVIQPLFLDKLHEELDKSQGNADKLKNLIKRLSKIKIFDPACGSGNFLIIAYKELRKLEMAAFKALDNVSSQKEIFSSAIRLSQFYGIEIDDFAHEIALLSLWLTEHQMNQAFQAEFGYSPPSLPLKQSGNIVADNSLRRDWNEVCPKSLEDEIYICGNPPFLGHAGRNDSQNEDMQIVLDGFDKFGRMDYVGCWFWKGALYIQNSKAELAFVATNSICQGVQVELLWEPILKKGVSIDFAYLPFTWKNSAKDNATVHVSIVGLSAIKNVNCRLYKQLNEVWHQENVSSIGPYLIPNSNVIVKARSEPLGKVSPIYFGSMPRDGGNLFLSENERLEFIKQDPLTEKWIFKILGSDEFFKGGNRYCLWLESISSEELESIPLIKARVEKVRKMRLASKAASTRDYAKTPHLFAQRAQPNSGNYLLVPRVSSERRMYLPTGFFAHNIIASDAVQIVPFATLYEFGLVSSTMHNDWMRAVGGRLESRYRYSGTLIYNTFPWPTVTSAQREMIEDFAETILLARERYPEKTIADLYDPDLMPQDLFEAHQALDREVERLYRERPFRDCFERLEHLFKLYEKLAASSDPKNMKIGSTEELW